ncbi:hypothetical protein B0H14DRAFT_2926139 [Mycena olivaceomarginata]|nr:hypothetical protein B0H14DRAFT_2926139 [Mycena olivaceomarginata]
MPKRLAGPGVPPPSPETPVARWGPLIDAVVPDREVVLDSATGFAGDLRGIGAGRRRGILPIGLGSSMRVEDIRRWRRGQTGTWRVVVSRTSSLSARAKWDDGVKGSGTEEDGEVDLVSGGVAADHTRKSRVRGKTRQRESKREVMPEPVCSPKTRKRWKADVPTPTYGPPRVGKDNGAVDADEHLPSPPPCLFLVPPPLPPRFGSPLAPPPAPGVLAGPSSNTSFALFSPMSPHPSAPRPASGSVFRRRWCECGSAGAW